MSTFDYGQSKQMAYRLVDKFGTDCKIMTKTKTKSAKCVLMSNTKTDKIDGPVSSTVKSVYVTGIDLEISPNDRITIKGSVYLITTAELYNFDNATKVLYVLTVAK